MAETKKKDTEKLGVYEKIFNVQQGVKTVMKGGYNDHFKYHFARERDIVGEVRPLLGQQRLVVTHTLIKEEEVPHGATSTGGQKFMTKLTFKFRITNVDNKDDFVEGDGIGFGQDSEDKGAPKAYTMALKYFFSKEFLIETGDDAEDTKGKKDPKGKDASGSEGKFVTAKRMIEGSRNLDGLLEYQDKLKESKTFNAAQKKELEASLKKRLTELEPQ